MSAAAVAVAHSAVGMEEWRDRQRGSGLPTGHAWENRGREGGAEGWKKKRRRGRHRKSPFINSTSPSKRQLKLQNLAKYVSFWRANDRAGEFQTDLKAHKSAEVYVL